MKIKFGSVEMFTTFVGNKTNKMNGLSKMLLGVFWIGCAIFAFVTYTPERTLVGPVASGFLIAIVIIVGVWLVGSGASKMQRGE